MTRIFLLFRHCEYGRCPRKKSKMGVIQFWTLCQEDLKLLSGILAKPLLMIMPIQQTLRNSLCTAKVFNL